MGRIKSKAILTARRIHLSLVWIALFAMSAFLLSALTHPLMVWTGPQAVKFRAPSMVLEGEKILHVANILNQIEDDIYIGKLVPSEQGPLLQVTQDPMQPRRYYSIEDNAMTHVPNYDQAQAVWLARHYTGQHEAISDVSFVNEFSIDYPWVNRLLPVYKITFATDDRLTVFVHTETGNLASISNTWKQALRTVFQVFHTWSWLDDYPLLRVLLVVVLLMSLLMASLGGMVMMVFIRRRHTPKPSQAWHRKLAWFVCIPFLGLLISALYHLLQYEYGNKPVGMQLVDMLEHNDLTIHKDVDFSVFNNVKLNHVTFIPHHQSLLLRASLAPSNDVIQGESRQLRNKRFDGIASEKGAFYINLSTINTPAMNDKQLIAEKAMDYLQVSNEDNLSLQLVTRFGPNYDFRNKRLPVWQVDVNNQVGDRIFVDPATGVIVEHLQNVQKAERVSFSLLHKWNFLVPMIGREGRDVFVVVFLLLLGVLTSLGLLLKNNGKQSRQPSVKTT